MILSLGTRSRRTQILRPPKTALETVQPPEKPKPGVLDKAEPVLGGGGLLLVVVAEAEALVEVREGVAEGRGRGRGVST